MTGQHRRLPAVWILVTASLFAACGAAETPTAAPVVDADGDSEDEAATDSGVADSESSASGSAQAPPTTTTSTVPEVEVASAPESDPITACQLEQSQALRMDTGNSEVMSLNGWPLDYINLSPREPVTAFVVPIDFSDAPGDDSSLSNAFEQAERVAEYFASESNGQFQLEVDGLREWVRLPQPLSAYPQRGPAGPHDDLSQAAVTAVDSSVDFSQVDVLLLAVPAGVALPTLDGNEWLWTEGYATGDLINMRAPTSAEGKVGNYLLAGPRFGDYWPDAWLLYAHSIAVMLGMPDLTGGSFDEVTGLELADSPQNSTGPFNGWGLLSNYQGVSKAIPAWTRWTMSWVSDDEIYCITPARIEERFEISLTPLYESDGGYRAVVIPLEDGTGVVLESRRPQEADADLEFWRNVEREPNGVLAYRTFPDRGRRVGPLIPIVPEGRGFAQLNGSTLDALMNEGDSIEFDGITVTLVKSADRDVLWVERQGDAGTAGSTSDDQTYPLPTGEPVGFDLIAGPAESQSDLCRVPQLPSSFIGGEGHTAFPVTFNNLQPDQNVRLLTIPVDWENYPGDPNELEAENEQVQIFMDYYELASNGELTFTPTFADRWYRMPEPIENYPMAQVSAWGTKLAQHGIDAIDPEIDFNDVDMIVFIIPENAPVTSGDPPTTSEFASLQHFNDYSAGDPRMVFSDEGFVRNYIGGGLQFDHPLRPVWSYYIHEAGHMFALPDWYLKEQNAGLGSRQFYGIEFELSIGPLNTWGVMSTQNGPSRTFVAWTRWLLGWLNDDQVDCYTIDQITEHGDFDSLLLPLDIYEDGPKAIMVRTGPYDAVVIESRRPVFPDHDLVRWEEVGRDPYGLIVYEVDGRIGGAAGTLKVVPPIGQTVKELPSPLVGDFLEKVDALFNVGAVAEIQGLRIELLHSGDRDLVRIGPAE